jgi:F-type H+-transporting ATPase subunit delta
MSNAVMRKVALRYAKAVVELAIEQNQLSLLTQDIKALQTLFTEQPSILTFLTSPSIPGIEKETLVVEQFEGRLSSGITELLKVLLKAHRIQILPILLDVLDERIEMLNGVQRVQLIVASKLPTTMQTKIRKQLETLSQAKSIILETIVDPTILAGAILRMGELVIDGCYRSKLDTLKKQVG